MLKLSALSKKHFDTIEDIAFFISILGAYGGHPSEIIKDAQGLSNIEASSNFIRLYSLYVERSSSESGFSFLAGIYDLNSEFYTSDSPSLFFNSSFGMGKELSQTGVSGPSIYPILAPAIRIKLDHGSSYIKTAVLSAQAGLPGNLQNPYTVFGEDRGFLGITEIGKHISIADSHSKYALGIWHYTRTFDAISGGGQDSINPQGLSFGYYAFIDQNITASTNFFVRYGETNKDVSQFKSCLTTGFVINNFLSNSKESKLGLAYASVDRHQNFLKEARGRGENLKLNESSLEINYRTEIIPSLFAQGAIQYITNPGNNPDESKQIASSIRLNLSL